MDHVGARQTLAGLGISPGVHSRPEPNTKRPNRARPILTNSGGEHGNKLAKGQRIERLGRERLAKLKSSGAEILFCYSIIASQFMAVSCSGGLVETKC